DDVYGSREKLPFEVDVRRDLTVAELRETLQERTDFFHYIGHTDEEGMECADGKLDAETLEENAVGAFLLNSCNSYGQGLGLIESGAIGGIVTLNEVVNDKAVSMGGLIARLLNAGFPLLAALDVAGEESIIGGQYAVVGDGGMEVAQAAGGSPYVVDVSKSEQGYALCMSYYATDSFDIGSVCTPHLADKDNYSIVPGRSAEYHVSEEELVDFLGMENMPVKIDGDLKWSYSVREEYM
ncbi:MAG: hypothetical protein ACI8XM_002050, partial [Haloarculaceae archaeon]